MNPAYLVPLKADIPATFFGVTIRELAGNPVFSVAFFGFLLLTNILVELFVFFLVYGGKAGSKAYLTVLMQNLVTHPLLLFFSSVSHFSYDFPLAISSIPVLFFAEFLVVVSEASMFYFVNRDSFSVREGFIASFLMNTASFLAFFGGLLFL